MGRYDTQLARLELFKQLQKSKHPDLSSDDITNLASLVFVTAETVGPLLERIPQTFKQYTEHNIYHSFNIITLIGKFLPKKTLKELNGLELAILIVAALLHDSGMYVSEQEKRQALDSADFKRFVVSQTERAAALEEARRAADHLRAETIQDSLLAEYFRRLHPERARKFVENTKVGEKTTLRDNLVFRGIDLAEDALRVCESHAWGVLESHDPHDPDKAVGKLATNSPFYGVPVNLQYLACCLRLGDIMDFDRSRTPIAVYQSIDFAEPKSWEEWNKHLQVKGWSISEYEVQFYARCTKPAFYVAVMEFLDWVDAELRECRHLLVKEAPKGVPEHYMLHLSPIVDRSKIEMADRRYLAGAFRFQLDYERIMQLLLDKSLYPDPSLFLRELLQNALDACRRHEARAKQYKGTYEPRIAVWDYSDDREKPRIVFQDNGVGMSQRIVQNYFMRVGCSYYRSVEFDAERREMDTAGIELEATSRFGIGILSCFMVADHFEVETYSFGNQPLHITIEGPTQYFTIRQLDPPKLAEFPPPPASDEDDGPPKRPGTRVTVYLRSDAKVDAFQVLDKFAVNVEYNLFVYRAGAVEPAKIERLRWESKTVEIQSFAETIVPEIPQPFNWRSDFSSLVTKALLKELNTTQNSSKENELQLEVVTALQDVIVASSVPFKKYDFSRHLNGQAWLWLLRDRDGEVCPSRGYLELDNELRCRGLPSFLGDVTYYTQLDIGSDNWKYFLSELRSTISMNMISADVEEISKIFLPIYNKDLNSGRISGSAQEWTKLTFEEREAACTWLDLYRRGAKQWFQVRNVVLDLLEGNLGWVNESIDFNGSIKFNLIPQSIALHGILLPGGCVEWMPEMGAAKQLRFLEVPGGLKVDVRSFLAPAPAANRLFVDSHEAYKIGTPFSRATLHHALDLAQLHLLDTKWKKWFSKFFVSNFETAFFREALRQEAKLIEKKILITWSHYALEFNPPILKKDRISLATFMGVADQFKPNPSAGQFSRLGDLSTIYIDVE